MNTPEFLLWAIEYQCPVRGFQDGSNPERMERQLRTAREMSEARREGRVFEGLCVQPPDGFRMDDAVAVYGGLRAVEAACAGCPANAEQQVDPQALAGCFGIVPLPDDARRMHEAVERAIEWTGVATEVERLFPQTQPRWYGLWMESPQGTGQAAMIEGLLGDEGVREIGGRWVSELQQGLQAARKAMLPVHTAIYPRGVVEGTRWRLVRHCAVCQAPWRLGSARHGRPEACPTCGNVGHPAPDKKRMARGKRPYYPLDRLLGTEQAEQFLVRYAEFQARRKLPELE